MKEKLKALWNRFVEGFETGAFNIALLVLSFLDAANVMPLNNFLPDKFGWVLGALAITSLALRFFVNMPWFKKFKDAPAP